MRLQRRLSDKVFQTQLSQDCLHWFVGWQFEGRYPGNHLIVEGAGSRFQPGEEGSPSRCSQSFIALLSDSCIWSFVLGIHIIDGTFATEDIFYERVKLNRHRDNMPSGVRLFEHLHELGIRLVPDSETPLYLFIGISILDLWVIVCVCLFLAVLLYFL